MSEKFTSEGVHSDAPLTLAEIRLRLSEGIDGPESAAQYLKELFEQNLNKGDLSSLLEIVGSLRGLGYTFTISFDQAQ
jgi:hypothetical protein